MKVFLRAFNISDGEKIYPWLLEKKNQSHTGGNTFFASKDYVKKWVEEKIFDTKNLYFAICSSETQEMIGYCSINNIDHRNRKAEGGGIILGNKEYCNTGIAVEALYLGLEYAFEELNINMMWTYILEEHIAAIKNAERVGFRKTGVLPQSVYKGGKYHNQIIMCILKEEYKPLSPSLNAAISRQNK